MHRFSFVSGKENHQSLKIEYYWDKHFLKATFIPKETHQSYPEIVHGGLLAAILDDAMAVSINHTGITALTGKLEVRFKMPAKIGEKLLITAWIDKQKRILYYTKGVIENENHQIVAEANAVFMRLDHPNDK